MPQFNVQLRDQGTPVRVANQEAQVTINIQRNALAPVFNVSYTRTIREDVNIGTSIITVTAYDGDTNVSIYILVSMEECANCQNV